MPRTTFIILGKTNIPLQHPYIEDSSIDLFKFLYLCTVNSRGLKWDKAVIVRTSGKNDRFYILGLFHSICISYSSLAIISESYTV